MKSPSLDGSKFMLKVKVLKIYFKSRSEIKVKVTRSLTLATLKRVSFIAKYEVSISYGLNAMAKVKGVFLHRWTDSQTDGLKTRCPETPFQRHKKRSNL